MGMENHKGSETSETSPEDRAEERLKIEREVRDVMLVNLITSADSPEKLLSALKVFKEGLEGKEPSLWDSEFEIDRVIDISSLESFIETANVLKDKPDKLKDVASEYFAYAEPGVLISNKITELYNIEW